MTLDINVENVCREIEKYRKITRDRVADKDLPLNLFQLTLSQRISVLVEEVGEVAEMVKIAEGLKPRVVMSFQEMRDNIEEELLQVGAIVLEWLLMDNPLIIE